MVKCCYVIVLKAELFSTSTLKNQKKPYSMMLLCQKYDYLISLYVINSFLGCPIPHLNIVHFQYFLPVCLCGCGFSVRDVTGYKY